MADETERQRRAREIYEQGIVHYPLFGGSGGRGGAGWAGVDYVIASGGGGGSGGHSIRQSNSTNFDPLVPDLELLSPSVRQRFAQAIEPTPEEIQDMQWTDDDALDIAREILSDERREGLRAEVTAAVAHYREMLADAHCGSVFSFMKLNDKGEHYWYAAIKNGGKWYTTALNPRVLEDDDALITWLVGLGAHKSEASELTQGAAHKALELGPIDTTATDE